MKIESPRFGTLEIDESRILHFERGLPGFPRCTRFIVMEHDRETPLKWLQCLDRPELAFLIAEPDQILPDYALEVPEPALAAIGSGPGAPPGSLAAFLILNVDEGCLTANLRAPVIVNIEQRRALQWILEDPELPMRQQIGA
ncbi:MAG: flagellar assembly protein FliW [Myxococcota bacterium]